MLKNLLRALLIVTLLSAPSYAQFGTGPFNKRFKTGEFGGVFGEKNSSGGGIPSGSIQDDNGHYLNDDASHYLIAG